MLRGHVPQPHASVIASGHETGVAAAKCNAANGFGVAFEHPERCASRRVEHSNDAFFPSRCEQFAVGPPLGGVAEEIVTEFQRGKVKERVRSVAKNGYNVPLRALQDTVTTTSKHARPMHASAPAAGRTREPLDPT